MLEHNIEQKKTLSLKKSSLFRSQQTHIVPTSGNSNNNNNKSYKKKAAAKELKISAPILQHSTTAHLFSSLISPTKSHYHKCVEDQHLSFELLYQPSSPAPRTPLQQKFDIANSQNPLLSPTKKDPIRKTMIKKKDNKDRNTTLTMKGSKSIISTSSPRRRHSCSSTAVSNHCNRLTSVRENNESNHLIKSSFCSKLKEHRRSNKVGSSYQASSSEAAASIAIHESCNILVVKSSKSTPLRNKIKTYNVPQQTNKKICFAPEDLERQRKMQELEDLITSRRGSTLKLTLTPKELS
ncbi:uncharacterized protein BX663DRAFT_493292 [Cokeromyces recurvatus]|uniref:uncharacterized protein n=1 Tax=Cokeromyces recurvatus TaxID=90255 RepID=UPI00221FDD52|nr:uncharacterized protein BX663DRAFT_493292 [Cokeromyces recurvatus]KAI7908178.1 hypothetical protein BX663DRAFT_493292 [Cokeromyces recurvatus]